MNRFVLLLLLLTTSISWAAPPSAESVFKISVKRLDPNTLAVQWNIQKGFFLYQNKIHIQPASNADLKIGQIILPKGIEKTNLHNDVYFIYREHLALPVPILGQTPGKAYLDVSFQGCSDDGYCYPPQQHQIQLTFNDQLSLTTAKLKPTTKISSSLSETPVVEPHNEWFAGQGWGLIILGFFSAGLLLAFTPCVLPMIPVLSSIIVGHGKDLTTRKAFLLSLSYVISMSITYSLIGAVIAILGQNLQMIMQSPWIVGLFSLIFILLALSMFDLYQLQLPLPIQNKLTKLTRNTSSGHYLNASIMGCLSILVLSPCVTAPLLGALTYIAQEGDMILGVLALFFLGLGMGAPLLLIGTSAGKLLPKAGTWMNTVKGFFGVILLGVAIYLLSRILPNSLVMALWGSLFVFSGIFLNAISIAKTRQEKLSQAIGLILLFYGFLMLIGASLNTNNPLQPLRQDQTFEISTRPRVTTLSQLQTQLIQATAENKPVILDFYAKWCESCKIIETTTLREPQVLKALQHFKFITVDLTANDANTQAIMKHFQVIAPPTFLFFNAQGKAMKSLRLVGEFSSQTLIQNAYKATSN